MTDIKHMPDLPLTWDTSVLAWKLWEGGGYTMWVKPMIYNHRIILGRTDDPFGYEVGWCYSSQFTAMCAALAFDPNIDAEPPGYVKQATCNSWIPLVLR